MNLAKKLRPGTLPAFDYAALGDPEAERRARAAVSRIQDLRDKAIVDIGRELLAMKELLPHGQFLPWVESFGMERRSATNYMRAAAEYGSKWETVSHLPAAVIYKLAAPSTPPAVRDAVAQLRPDQVVTVGNVQELIDTAKAGERRKARDAQREQARQEQEAHRAKWEARDARERAQRERDRERARYAAERARTMLDGSFAALCEMMRDVDVGLFAHEFDRLMQQHRASSTSAID